MQHISSSPRSTGRLRVVKGFAATEVVFGVIAVALMAFGLYKLLTTPWLLALIIMALGFLLLCLFITRLLDSLLQLMGRRW